MNSHRSHSVSGDILIIDDIPDNLRFLSELLTKANYKVRKVTSGERGIEAALLEPPDLILLDIKMPGMNGYDVCDRLKTSDRTSNIPIIFLSALDEEIDKVMAFEAGGVDYIIKPFQVVEVLARIATHLKVSRLQQQLQQQNIQLQQEIEYRNSAEAALEILNQGLDARIQERTADLREKNEQLLGLQTDLQEALAQSQRINMAQSQWIHTIVQEFRHPMAMMTSAIELLKQEEPHGSPDVQRYIQTIAHNTASISRMLQDIMTLLDAETQPPPLHLVPLDLTEFCRSLVEQWPLPEHPTYQLLFVHWGNSAEFMQFDVTRLQQICSHLMANAIRYSPAGGSILFELLYETEQVVIRIRDGGIGIPADDLERILDRFYRAKNADWIGPSAGLGLAVVKQAVERLDGTIAIDSELNKGTIVTVTLPKSKD